MALAVDVALLIIMLFSPWAIPANAHYSPWLIVPLALAQIGIREATHAVAADLFGAKPRFGVRFLVAYCTFTERATWGGYLHSGERLTPCASSLPWQRWRLFSVAAT
jgi:hypothetical protein